MRAEDVVPDGTHFRSAGRCAACVDPASGGAAATRVAVRADRVTIVNVEEKEGG